MNAGSVRYHKRTPASQQTSFLQEARTKTRKRRKPAPEPVPGEDYVRHFETARTIWLQQDTRLRKATLAAEGWLSWQATRQIHSTILESDPVLYGLEFDRYVQPLLNREAWAEYKEQRAIAEELAGDGQEPEIEKPRCPLLFEWLGETPKLSYDLIAQHVYPRIDPASGRVVVTDWREMVAEKADVDVAVEELHHTHRCLDCSVEDGEQTIHSRRLGRVVDLAREDNDLEVIAHRLGVELPETIAAVRAVDKHVRARTRRDALEDDRPAQPRCAEPDCGAPATHARCFEPRCFEHSPEMPRPRDVWLEPYDWLTWGSQRFGGTDPVRFEGQEWRV